MSDEENPISTISEMIDNPEGLNRGNIIEELIGDHAEAIGRIIADQPMHLPNWKEDSQVEDWFTKITRQNQLLADAYGIQTNALGASMGQGVLEMNQQVKLYYDTHPEDRFIQKTYTELLTEKKITPMLEKPESIKVNRVKEEVVKQLENLSEDTLKQVLDVLKKSKETTNGFVQEEGSKEDPEA